MGVTGDVLQRVLRTAGREIDLTKYKYGILTSEEPPTKRQRLRPLRIGLDVSNWIARAAHGNGAMLVDDRHLTNYGRSRLSGGGDYAAEAAVTDDYTIDMLTSEENRRNYIETCTQRVLKQIQNLECMSQADIIVVLDGASPPIKKEEVQRRREKMRQAARERDARDEQNKKTLERRIKAGKAAGAGSCYGIIIRELLQLLREQRITFIVAPYEADGQLAYLCQVGAIDMVITEDSDLLCQNIPSLLFKYNWDGEGILVQRNDLGAVEKKPRTLCLLDFSTSMLAIMFVSIGCDYCDSLKGIGSVTARNIVSKVFLETKNAKSPALLLVFDLLYDYTSSKLTAEEQNEYESRFLGALFMYQHPVIFCPKRCQYIFANDPPRGSDPILLEYEPYALLCQDVTKQHELLGAFPERKLQVAIAEGWINPYTLRPYPDVPLPSPVQKLLDQGLEEGHNNGETSVVNENVIPGCDKPSPRDEQESTFETQGEQEAAEDTQESRSEAHYIGDPETQCFESPSPERNDTQGSLSTQQIEHATQHLNEGVDSRNITQNREEGVDESCLENTQDVVEDGTHTDDDATVKFESIQSPFQSFLSPVQDNSQNEGRMLNIQMSSSSSVKFSSSPSVALTQETSQKSPHQSTQSSRTTLNQDSSSKLLSTQSSGNSNSRLTSQSSSALSPALLP